MIKILIADDDENVGNSIELIIKRSISNTIDIVKERRFANLSNRIETYKPHILLMDIHWDGLNDAKNAGLNFVINELAASRCKTNVFFVSGLPDADKRIRLAGLAGFTLIDKSDIADFPFSEFVDSVRQQTDLEREYQQKRQINKFKDCETIPDLEDKYVQLYKYFPADSPNNTFQKFYLLSDIVCLESTNNGKNTNVIVYNKREPFRYSKNIGSFISDKIRNREYFNRLFRTFGGRESLFVNKSYIVDYDLNESGNEAVKVKWDLFTQYFSAGYDVTD